MVIFLLLTAVALAVSYFVGSRRFTFGALLVICGLGFLYYTILLTSGNIHTFFTLDPYSRIYPNLWDHAVRGDFGIDPQYAFREYFITDKGTPTVYFGFMPAILRGVASLVTSNIYSYNLGNLSILISVALIVASLLFTLHRLKLLEEKTRPFSIGVVIALLFASPLSYEAIWGRVHNEVIAWGAAWGVVFVCFFALWIFTGTTRRSSWWLVIMGLAVGMAVLSRPTVALSIGLPFGCLILYELLTRARDKKLIQGLVTILPGTVCALILILFAMAINYQRWGSPLTFVKMYRHVELLEENPHRGEDLRKAGEFNLNRFIPSAAYYLLPNSDNVLPYAPYIQIDQRLSAMKHVPQYDYIEGSRVPLTLSALFLIIVATIGIFRIRTLENKIQFLGGAVVVGGLLTFISLCTVYAVALRYTIDMVPVIMFGAILFLKTQALQKKATKVLDFGWYILLTVSVFITTLTTLQYKIISGQIGLPMVYIQQLSKDIHFPAQENAKLFIIDGTPAPGIRY